MKCVNCPARICEQVLATKREQAPHPLGLVNLSLLLNLCLQVEAGPYMSI